mmetsp:Transcript_40608/g.107614  ORF Transcript_40608/g.107614 Transcript_40608/m.107614 type:complete len:216 (-) Transcript_40608:15-662(-)
MQSVSGLFTSCLVHRTKEKPQFLILGLDGVGKTMLLYKLKFNKAWGEKMEDELAQMRKPNEKDEIEDCSYHYEEFTSEMNCGIWEVPGTPAMIMTWKYFYSAIRMHAVIFVVDSLEEDEQRIELSKRLLHGLLNEDELRRAAFLIIFNNRGGDPNPEPDTQTYYKLGLHNLHPSHKWRVETFTMNVKYVHEHSEQWQKVTSKAKAILALGSGTKR